MKSNTITAETGQSELRLRHLIIIVFIEEVVLHEGLEEVGADFAVDVYVFAHRLLFEHFYHLIDHSVWFEVDHFVNELIEHDLTDIK